MKCVLIIIALVYGISCGPVDDDVLQEFVNGNHRFTAAIYKELIKNETGSVIISPLSAETVLALTNEGARGQTATEFVTGLSLPSSSEKTHTFFKSFLPKLKTSDEDLKLLSANRIFVGERVELEDSFKSVATNVYGSSVGSVNFAQNVKAAQTINKWVEDTTDNKIKDLIDPQILDDLTKIVLVNAIYFSGKWVTRFEENQTRKKTFHRTKDDTVEVDTMHLVKSLNYYDNPTLNATFLELPYKGDNISMVIVLPNEIDGIAKLEEHIEQVFQPQPFEKARVDVDLPKFTIETEIDFVPILKSLGIQRVFDDRADLTGLSSTNKNLYVSDVIQKVYIDVAEAGTKAAVATAVNVRERSGLSIVHPTFLFHADRPFFYFIKLNNIVVVAGRYNSK